MARFLAKLINQKLLQFQTESSCRTCGVAQAAWLQKPPVTEVGGREEAGEKYYIQTPDRYFGLEVVQAKAPLIYTLDNVVNWQH